MPDRIVCAHRGASGDDRLWFATYEGAAWSGDTEFSNGARSASPPSLAKLGEVLYCVHRGGDGDDRLWWSTFDPKSLKWSEDQAFSGDNRSASGPAIANHRGVLYAIHRGANDNGLWWTTFEPSTQQWMPDKRHHDAETGSQPALISFGDYLYCVYRGDRDQDLWFTRYGGGTWSGSERFSHGNQSSDGPGLFVWSDGGVPKLYCIHKGRDSSSSFGEDLWWSRFEDPNWTEDKRFSHDNLSAGSPAAIAFGDKAHCVHRGARTTGTTRDDQHLWSTTFDGSSWSEDYRFQGENRSVDGVALAVVNFPERKRAKAPGKTAKKPR